MYTCKCIFFIDKPYESVLENIKFLSLITKEKIIKSAMWRLKKICSSKKSYGMFIIFGC